MNRTPNYEDCVKFVENILKTEYHRELYDFQKEILKAFIEGKEVRVARGGGRTFMAKMYGLYIGSLYAENDYTIEPEVTINYETIASEINYLVPYDELKQISPEEYWNLEYECKGTKERNKFFNLDHYLYL